MLAAHLLDLQLEMGDQGFVARRLGLRRGGVDFRGDPSTALGDQGRSQLCDIVGKVMEIAVHVRHIITKAGACGAPIRSLNQYAVGSSGRLRPPCPLRMPPVDPLQQIAELSRRDDDRAIGGRRPDEATALQALGVT